MPIEHKLIRSPSVLSMSSAPQQELLSSRHESSGILPEISKQLDDLTKVIVELEAELVVRAQRFAVRYEVRIDPLAQLASKATDRSNSSSSAVAQRTSRASPGTISGNPLVDSILTTLAGEYIAHHFVFEFISVTKVKGVWGLYYEARQMNAPTIQIPLREASAEKKRIFMQICEQFVDGFEEQVRKAIADSGIENGNRALAKLKRLE